MKISKKEEDFRIYVENNNGQYISSTEILKAEKYIDKRINFKIFLSQDLKFNIELTREEMGSLAELTNEVCKYL